MQKHFIDQQMLKTNESTSQQIWKKLAKCPLYEDLANSKAGLCSGPLIVSSSKMLTESSGWRTHGAHALESSDTFDKIMFSDKCSISLQKYLHTCYRKVGEPMEQKAKLKHVHVWAGISRHGATEICIFDGIMDATSCNILESTLVSFIQENS